MVIVAVAGGTGGVGRAIVSALISQNKHEVLILSRAPNADLEKEVGARVVAVDYNSVPTLTEILEHNNVHSVVSALNMMPNAGGALEQNLIAAADASQCTKRMIPSQYGFPQSMEDAPIIPSILNKGASLEALQASKTLEWTVFHIGLFMDYFGMSDIPSHLSTFVVLLDMAGNAAAVPGNGESRITVTHTCDVGRFVAASIDLEKWERVSTVIGDQMTMNEAVALAEEVKGTKFKVGYDDVEKLKRGEVTELPSQRELYSVFPEEVVRAITSRFGIWIERGDLDFDERISLNQQLPEIKALKFREFLEKAWTK